MNVGFIGLGQMGSAMAAQLLARGHTVSVWNRSADKAAPLLAAGARAAASPAEAAQGDVVLTMLADDTATEAVVYGPHGLLGQPAVHVAHGTLSVTLADRLARDHGADAYVSAPVFGRPAAARSGTLAVVAAGAAVTIERVRPVLEAVGRSVFTLGPAASAANRVKLGGNFLLVALVEAFAEAMTLVEAGGIERRAFFDIITRTLLDVPVARTYGELLVTGAFRPAGFPALLALKDMNLVDAAASDTRVPMPLLGILRDHLRAVVAGDGADLDLAAIGQALRPPVPQRPNHAS